MRVKKTQEKTEQDSGVMVTDSISGDREWKRFKMKSHQIYIGNKSPFINLRK